MFVKKKSFAMLLIRSSKIYNEDVSTMIEKLKVKGYEVAVCRYHTMIESNASLIYYNPKESSVDIQDYIATEGDESNPRQSLQVTFYVPADDYTADDLDCLYRWLDIVYVKAEDKIDKFSQPHYPSSIYIRLSRMDNTQVLSILYLR